MFTLEQFKDSKQSLVICHGDKIAFESPESALRPLVEYLEKRLLTDQPITMFDKCIGRAAASLMAMAGADRVHGLVVSDGGAQTLEDADISFQAEKRVEYLMGTASENMCRWEKFAVSHTPEELLAELRRIHNL